MFVAIIYIEDQSNHLVLVILIHLLSVVSACFVCCCIERTRITIQYGDYGGILVEFVATRAFVTSSPGRTVTSTPSFRVDGAGSSGSMASGANPCGMVAQKARYKRETKAQHVTLVDSRIGIVVSSGTSSGMPSVVSRLHTPSLPSMAIDGVGGGILSRSG